jgi:hypothetical protein
MNRDDIIRMAREVGLHSAVLLHIYEGKEAALTDSEQDELRRIERFAALVAASEREACAKVCDDMNLRNNELRAEYQRGLFNAALAIRARGETK